MRLNELIESIDGVELTPTENPEISGGYVGDLMSDIIANAEEGTVWVTMQIHVNMVAVAAMKDLAAVIICSGRSPETEVVEKAREQEVTLISSPLPAFEICGRLYELGIGG